MAFLWSIGNAAERTVHTDEPRASMLRPFMAERRAALKVVKLQGVIGLAVAGALASVWGWPAGRSALLGGGVGMVATLFFVVALFRYPEGVSAARVAWGLFFGQALKVALTVALLLAAFRSSAVVAPALLGGYAATFAAYWWASRGPASRW